MVMETLLRKWADPSVRLRRIANRARPGPWGILLPRGDRGQHRHLFFSAENRRASFLTGNKSESRVMANIYNMGERRLLGKSRKPRANAVTRLFFFSIKTLREYQKMDIQISLNIARMEANPLRRYVTLLLSSILGNILKK